MDVRGKQALVTGASSGIGEAIALRLAREGAHVLAHGRDTLRTGDIARRTGGTALVSDLGAPEAAGQLAEQAGAVDLVVASAGFGWSGPFVEMTGDAIDEMVAVDLLAPLRLVRALLPGMLERGSGHVVLVSSVAGRTGVAGEAVYAACKAAIDAFAESLRLELVGSGVGVTVVVPGAVETPFFQRRGRPYDRGFPRQVSADAVAEATLAAIRRDAAEVWSPGWLKIAPRVRALAPGAYRRLSARFGERVRSESGQA